MHRRQVPNRHQVESHDAGRDHRGEGHVGAEGFERQVAHEEEGDAAALMRILAHDGALCHVLHESMPQVHQAVDIVFSFLVAADEKPLGDR